MSDELSARIDRILAEIARLERKLDWIATRTPDLPRRQTAYPELGVRTAATAEQTEGA
jgi:hypothetical protein